MGKMEFYKWLQGIYSDVKSQEESVVTEAWVGPFMFSDKTSDEELKLMRDAAVSGFANWQKGFEYPKADYKKAYQEIEKLLKKRGVKIIESKTTITEAASKTILGVQFNVVPAQAGMKFEFKNVNQFRKSGVTINQLVDEITKMLDSKFSKGLFTFMPAGKDQTDPKVNGLEFRMSANQFFKGL
jgi:hypothetical protein